MSIKSRISPSFPVASFVTAIVVILGMNIMSVSCTDRIKIDHQKDYVVLTLNSVEMENPLETVPERTIRQKQASKVADVSLSSVTETNEIKYFWLMLFDANKNFIKATYYDHYSSSEGLHFYLEKPKGDDKYTIVILANVKEKDLDVVNLFQGKTIDEASKYIKTFATIDDLERIASPLVKVGKVELGKNDSNLSCKMYNCLAKITLSVENNTSSSNDKMIIQNIEVLNIPSQLACFLPLYDKLNITPSELEGECKFLSYKRDQELGLKPGSKINRTYYISPNLQGEPTELQNNNNTKDKNKHAPKVATCVVVTALPEGSDGSKVYKYKFYLGDDMLKNFDVRPNHNYILNIKINAQGEESSDSRVEKDIYVIDLSSKDANSYIINSTAKVQPFYHWKIDRGNTYWEKKNVYDVYISLADDKPSNFKIVKGSKDTEGTEGTEGTHIRPIVIWEDYNTSAESGSGSSDVITFYDKEGNRLGVDKDGNPKEDWFTTMDNCFFKVKKGTKGNALIGIVTEDAYKQGKNAKEQLYAWSWHLWLTDYQPAENANAMDRNLGTIDKSSSIYYQFGRKDPFSKDCYVAVDGGGNFNPAKSVVHPYSFAKVFGPWLNHTLVQKTYWFRHKWDTSTGNGKTYMDPCPSGWRLPDKEEASKLINNNVQKDGYINYEGKQMNDWPSIIWTSSLENETYGYVYNLNPMTFLNANACPVRCVRDTK